MNKKAMTGVVVIGLLLLVSAVSVITLSNWFNENSSNLKAKFENKNLEDYITVNKIENMGSYSELEITNVYGNYFIVEELKIRGQSCSLTSSNVIISDSVSYLSTNCTFARASAVDLLLVTNGDIYEKNLISR